MGVRFRGHRHRSLRTGLTVVGLAVAMTATGVATASALPPAAGDSAASIVLTEQATDRILVLASDRKSFENAEIQWEWRPSAANGLADLAVDWGVPDEAKLRYRDGKPYLLTTDSWGFVGVIAYPEGTPYWATSVGRGQNPHSIELLPDGNVAIAASTGGWLRIYTASQGPRSSTYIEVDLHDAHGVHWDEERQLLWALGGNDLLAYRLGGMPDAPTLTEVRRTALPTPYGHDLTPVAANPDRLWITTGSQVYQYSINEDTFTQDYRGANQISRSGVKAVGDDAESGQVLTTYIQPGNLCTWCTNTVTLYNRTERLTLHGSQIYKARWWHAPPPEATD